MQLSKKQVDKAGEVLRLLDSSNEQALDTLAEWRSRHVYPLRLAFSLLKRETDKIGNHALYGQRLKRVSSIVHKLERLPQAKLSRLQDIGGCRVILSNYDKLRQLYLKLQKSKAILDGHKDYITYPKLDGYRSIHLIYCCNSKDEQYKDLKIELQLRTKFQHAWATAVEIIDSFEGQNLKLGKGSDKWKDFFYYVADEFAIIEKAPIHNNSLGEDRIAIIKRLVKELNVIDKLKGYTIISKATTSKNSPSHVQIKNFEYCILALNIETANIQITTYKEITTAQSQYIKLEKEHLNNAKVNVLLVKSTNIKSLKKSYPNYFADSQVFLQALNLILTKPD